MRIAFLNHQDCTGCLCCQQACSFIHNLSFNPKRSRIFAYRNDKSGEHEMNACRHCPRPDCVPACPQEAIWIRDDGTVLIDLEKCDGCKDEETPRCIEACRYDGVHIDPITNKALKCDLCDGINYACIDACPRNVLEIRGVKANE